MAPRGTLTGRRFGAIAAGALALVVAAAFAAQAEAANRGAANAVFRASLTGGLHNPGPGHGPGAWGYAVDGVRVDPFLDGVEYCVSGWHLVSIGVGDSLSAYPDRTALRDALAESRVEFTLDGVSLPVERTSVHPYPSTLALAGDLLALNAGAFLPPGSLAVGAHDLFTVIERPGVPPMVTAISFVGIDC